MPKTLSILLKEIVDYAGLFPPAGLDMERAVANYAEYRRSPHAWMLGRFVVPAAHLDDLANAMAALGESGWHVSALVGENIDEDMARVAAFNAASRNAKIDAIEVRASSESAIHRITAPVPGGMHVYVEIPIRDDPRGLVKAIAAARMRAKVRTGGVTAESIPAVEEVARFIRACYANGVAFKATAGLHHPMRSERDLTYEPRSRRAVMHGFLNVFLAAALCYNGLTVRHTVELLQLESVDGIAFDDGITWGEYRLSPTELMTVRRRFAIAFGSCSFLEPVDDLTSLGLLS